MANAFRALRMLQNMAVGSPQPQCYRSALFSALPRSLYEICFMGGQHVGSLGLAAEVCPIEIRPAVCECIWSI